MSSGTLRDLGLRAKAASRVLASTPGGCKDAALDKAAVALVGSADEILAANGTDVANAVAGGVSATVVDRLRLDEKRIESMGSGLSSLASLADPVGEVLDGWVRPNGLAIRRVRVPLGVVAVIYENRPNVTSDAAGLCLKSGNAALLRGSSGAIHSNKAIAEVIRGAYRSAGLPEDCLVFVDDPTRESVPEFLRLDGLIDCLIPRGGRSLIETVKEHATVPYVIDGDGNCHVYVDASADLDMAVAIVANAKTQRPSVCNAAETLLVHADIAQRLLEKLDPALESVELRGDRASRAILGENRVAPATDEDYATEFLDLILSVKVVAGVAEAIEHIGRFGSGHTEAIVTSDLDNARRFQQEVDAAAVVVNASTRFTDGEQFGFGAEIGISTQKLHARGPMGLRELTTVKYLLDGTGQVRT